MTSNQDKLNKTFMDKIDDLGVKLNEALVKLETLPSKLTIELDERYADKRTEKNVDRLSWLVISVIVVAGIAIIVKQ